MRYSDHIAILSTLLKPFAICYVISFVTRIFPIPGWDLSARLLHQILVVYQYPDFPGFYLKAAWFPMLMKFDMCMGGLGSPSKVT